MTDPLAEIADRIRRSRRAQPAGSASKTRLPWEGAEVLSAKPLDKIVEYNPGEYVIAAQAGTPLRDVAAALAECGQTLPFDPPLVDEGATLGGTVAAGLNGPGAFRFGGLRDFILGAAYLDAAGRMVRTGGKVVKNAAGFDIPKLMVGSMGSLGFLAELIFKVFPGPEARATIEATCPSLDAAVKLLQSASRKSWDLEALELLPPGRLLVRLGGAAAALDARVAEIRAAFPAECRRLRVPEAEALWAEADTFSWRGGATCVKIPITPPQIPSLDAALTEAGVERRRYGIGGNVAYLAAADLEALDGQLRGLGLVGLPFLGAAGAGWIGRPPDSAASRLVKDAFDPFGKFPSFSETCAIPQ